MENNIKNNTDNYILNTYKRQDIIIEKGNEVYLFDADGKKYLDYVSGIGVNSLGYQNKTYYEANVNQLNKFNHCSNLYYWETQSTLAKKLINISPFDKVFFANSGAEANEGALKLAKKYGKTKNRDLNCTKIITMKNSFHGRTLGSLSVTAQSKYQTNFAPLLPGILEAEFNDIGSVKKLISDKVCAIIVEPIQGEGGLKPANKEFLQGLRKICDENDIILIFDEVQCGVGRTGKFFSFENYDVIPDVVTMAKGLANGLPIGAFMVNKKYSSILTYGDHASTFGGNPISTAGANVVVDEIINNGILNNVKINGEYLFSNLNKLKSKYDFIKEVRGLGFMVGVDFEFEVASIISHLKDKGLLVLNAGNNVLRLLPPLIVNKKHIDEAIGILDEVLSEIKISAWS